MKPELTNELEMLIEEAEKLVPGNIMGEQVIAVKTAKGNVHCFKIKVLDSKYEKMEDCFIQKLQNEGDAEIQYIVCMWNNYSTDVPSMNFRRRLLEACAKNAGAMIFLQGRIMRLEETLPEYKPDNIK